MSPNAMFWTQVAALCFLILIACQVYGLWRAHRQAAASRGWPAAEGEIIACELERRSIEDDSADECFAAAVRYRYQVNGQNYEGDAISVGGPAVTTRALAEKTADRYPVGRRLRVYYDPRHPASALLEKGINANLAAMIVFLIVFVAIEAVLISIIADHGHVPTTEAGMPWFAFLLPLAAIALAIAALAQYVLNGRVARASRNWPVAPGKITASRIEIETRTASDNDDRERAPVERYRPHVTYSYRVGNADYHGSTLTWGGAALHGDSASAEAVTHKYPVGSGVSVYYDPDDPSHAALEPNNRRGSAMMLVFAVLFGSVGLIFLKIMTNL
jgi:hypothetical protein